MKKTLKLSALMFLLAGVNSMTAQGQDYDRPNVVTTAVPFLRISPDARAGGMGDMGVATAPDANSGFWNLAKTPFTKNDIGIGVTYTPWLKDLGLNDVYLLAGSGYYKLDENQALSASVRYFSLGNIQFTNFGGTDLGEGRPREFGIDVGYSRKLSDKIGLGIALRYINSNLASGAGEIDGVTYKAGNAVAGDLSFFYTGANESGQGWNFGATLTNLGTKIAYTNDATQKDYIPANLSLGAAYTAVFDESNKITFGVDLHKLLVPTPPVAAADDDPDKTYKDSVALADYRDKNVMNSWFSSFGDDGLKAVQASIGVEYNYSDQFFVRAGYFYEDKNKGNRKYFTLGLGLKYNVFGLNFSYLVPSGSGVNRNPLSNTLRFGLLFDLEK